MKSGQFPHGRINVYLYECDGNIRASPVINNPFNLS